MLVHTDIQALPEFNKAVITIGTFDGVHTGHQQILDQLKKEAASIGGETVLITFYPHPRKVVGDSWGVRLLTTLQEKITLLNKFGIHHLVVVPFDEHFSRLTADEYIKDFLVKLFKPKTVIIGYDHKFGKNRQGDYHLLEDYGSKLGFVVKEIPEHVQQEAVISSTLIRKALLKSDLHTANSCLGYRFFIHGKVIEGDRIGRTIGYPTANIQINDEEKLIPADGVYAVTVCFPEFEGEEDKNYGGMLYIGSRPVVNGTRRVIEVNVFQFNKDVYDQDIRVHFVQYIRGDIHFKALEELKIQLGKDQEDVLNVLAKANSSS